MDAIDRKIVDTLQQNGRITNVELARMNDLAPSSMLARVRRLEERGIITGYRAVLDPKALGYTVMAIVMINLDQHQAGSIAAFEERVRSIPEVKMGYHITGRYDYMLQVVVRDIDHLGELIKHTLAGIPGLERQETFLMFSAIKDDGGYSMAYLEG